jgi:uncharacterized OB-fold protein
MGFLEKQTDPTSPMHWRGNMQADYFYPAGIAGDKLFKHIKTKDTFLASKCPKCEKVFFPPMMYCEDCFDDIPESSWMEVPSEGEIKLFTVAKLDAHGEKMETPKVVALIQIEKTDGKMLGVINTSEYDKDFMGLKVKAVLKPNNEREGTLKDILYWE